ncbi:MAG: inosine-5'-monophosphate dehydrogenase [Candidatus Methanoperedens nitroreducens]|uniref:Inosine-5'-monophosphate dehydrogenase n=1 Tax=Candidatus Methanoperedens nitratireducens TaxID=1392998 RepID=A0A0P7ZGG7_9EURY|nr:CBS domain-containing protein [Candidatus Methanoperedens sp. BLZ2]KAB2946023.1 MAG: CBS domain-containing protein [Candidatus Methanoperedens sp.]KPQ43934.1 MAG: inosine-5'-monophosphate dehydrogenase [Candidatus Methanoperedens sp. BLZ1]MBZ0175259.1 CBS domain-containing protein [Candidatus Methanoperedens nitroreducens]MCX9076533.1 CBS domain-containing protein [Candidatus Methanoperedens sp.]
MKVSERMTKNPITVNPSATAKDVAEKMEKENVGTVLVTDGGRLKGIVIDRQIITKVIAAGKDPAKVRVSEFMTESPVTANFDMEIEEASRIIGEKGFRRIPVVENGKPVGIISVADIVEHARTCTECMTNILSEAAKAER